MQPETDTGETHLPLVAPCRALPWNAALGWLRAGWQDMRRAPGPSLFYGMVMVAISYAITFATWYLGRIGIYLGVMSGFVFLGPLLALRLYAISNRLEKGVEVSLAATFRDAGKALSDAMVFALILLVVVLVWARAATMVHIFFPTGTHPALMDWARFLGIGSAIGSVFCAVIFMASAFSLPMILDRRCDTVTAVVTSVNATLRNKPAMVFWAICIGACVVFGVATAYVGFVVVLPLLGHAAWHGYRQAVDASAWPERLEAGAPASP